MTMGSAEKQEFGRRAFLKISAAAILSIIFDSRTAQALNALPPHSQIYPRFAAGLHNAHILPEYLKGVTVRLPLNRAAFDENNGNQDPFYNQSSRLLEWRAKGSNTILVMEIHPEDSFLRLAKMFDTAQEVIEFKKGDTVVLGNEINIPASKYTPGIYARQFTDLQKHIKSIVPQVQTGFAGQAWSEDGEFVKNTLSILNTPFDVLPIHYYGLPQNLPYWVILHRNILDQSGLYDVPISIGEEGVADSTYPDNPAGFLQAKTREQADAILKAFCFARASGCTSLNWYSAVDTRAGQNGHIERYGLLDDNNRQRPGFAVFKQALAIFKQPGSIRWSYVDGEYVFILEGAGFKTEISWSCPDPQTLGGFVKVQQLVQADFIPPQDR